MQEQERTHSKPDTPNAATRNIDLMALELEVYGQVSPEVKAMVLDEELTHAAEILVAQEAAYAIIPRIYHQIGDDLIDIHNQSLKQVFNGGIKHSQNEVLLGVAGAEWELMRRKAELNNLETILSMPENMVCIEISAPPVDKPKEEQLAQHYNGLTMIRASIKEENGKITQYNYAMPLANPEFILTVQNKLGCDPEDQVVDTQQLLENPILQKFDQTSIGVAQDLDSLIGAAILEVSVGHSAVRMIKKAMISRREAWDFATSDAHSDIRQEFLDSMEHAALLNIANREHAMAAIRSGLWKEYKDRFNGRHYDNLAGNVLSQAASRAVVDADIFIACGSTISATALTAEESIESRAQTADNLLNEVKGNGTCGACGAKGRLFGCGIFCNKCNAKWCAEYKRSGKQLSAKELAYLNYGRGTNLQETQESSFFGNKETLGQHWERIGQELRQKRLAKKLQDAETIMLAKETMLVKAA